MTAVSITRTAAPPAPPTWLRVFGATARAEWTKLRSVRSTVWTLLTTVGLAIGFGALIGASHIASWDSLDAAERLMFDPTAFSLAGLFIAQLAIGVLGVLVVTSEYATGQVRATFAATPQRLILLAAKAGTFTLVALGTGLVASFGAFWVGQAIFAGRGLDASITDPGVLRAVVGGAVFLAGVGLLGVGVGTILRRTAGGIATLAALLFVIPLVTSFLPASIQELSRFLPAQAGMAIFNVIRDPLALSPAAGMAVFAAYGLGFLAVGGVLLTRRDA